MFWIVCIVAAVAALALAHVGRGWLAWVVGLAILLAGWLALHGAGVGLVLLTLAAALLALVTGWPVVRCALISRHLRKPVGTLLPRLGETERIALEAGTVWWDGDLFTGMPDWQKLLDYKCQPLGEREQAFLDGPVEELCRMLDDWQVEQERGLSDEVWDFLKREKFFGMIIPRKYGGLEFSQIGHSRIVTRIASRSITAAVTVMVPNSLGPAELLLHYGSEDDKQKYLPRLADGRDIPCFALTGPEAGSDAAATQSTGVVEHGQWHGEQVLGMRLNWNKRYITLAPVATLIGLAFRLKDPHGLLGDVEDLGITCALISRDLPGIRIGRHHDPMGVPFDNGPIQGEDVFVPLDAIIGGREQIGHGWRMLMESLAAGRSISLPALSIGAVQMATRITGAYSTVREQFDTPIGRFEGIEEPLARIAGKTWMMSATRTLTCAALDAGERPAVLGNVAKAYLTEGMREVVSDAMDIRAGSAIQRGPRNLLSRMWMAIPIGITVEGANILTRSMIIYGQGAIRSHPFVGKLIDSVAEEDNEAFDHGLFGYINFFCTRFVRTWLLGLSGGRLARAPRTSGMRRYYQRLSRYSAAFAFISDIAMGTLGGSLKRREKISGRMADVLANLYMASASLKRYHDEPKLSSSEDLACWSVQLALYRIQGALQEIIANLPLRPLNWVLRCTIFPLGARQRPPSDALGRRVARAVLEDREARLRLTEDIFVPPADELGLGRLEAALDKAVRAIPVETKLRDALRSGRLERAPGVMLDDAALSEGVIDEAEHELLSEARVAREEVIQVDTFSEAEYKELH
ncbi:MAG: acyl-CoA dehydrogenase [Rhodanobacteraceae bacterium]